MKILIKSDVYNICKRIQNFDKSYRLIYDTNTKQYKIYSIKSHQIFELIDGIKLSYVCTLPYNELDERSIKHLYNTSIDNINEIVNQMDKYNQKLEHEKQLKLKNQSLEVAENKLRQLTK